MLFDIFSKYPWVIPLQDRKSITISNGFQKIFNGSRCKPSKVRVNKGSEFYNRLLKSWLQDNYVELYTPHNEGKSLVAEIFIRSLKNKIYKYMTSVSNISYVDKSVS